MCCYSTREALILGGGFPNRLQGRYCFQRAHNGFQDRCIMYYLFIDTLEDHIRKNSL